MRDTIIYIYPSNSTFVQKDIEFLSKKYKVLAPKHNWVNKLKLPFLLIKQMFFLLANTRKSKAFYVMFGGYWSLLPVLIGKVFGVKTFIILGGTDCVSFPKLQYGQLRKPLLKAVIKWSYKLAYKLLPVDNSLVSSNYSYWEEATYKNQGYLSFFKNIKTSYKEIPNGFDFDFFSESIESRKTNSFITIAKIDNDKTFQLKGIDKVLYLAKEFPQSSFTIIGVNKEVLASKEAPDNITFLPFTIATEFIEHLKKHEFVLQLSISEGFPNALCEAMLCGCIPVVSNVGAMPKIIKDNGFVMKSSNNEYLKNQFSNILRLSEEQRKELSILSRKNIKENYPISKREELFLQEIEA